MELFMRKGKMRIEGLINIILILTRIISSKFLTEESPMNFYNVYQSESYVVVENRDKQDAFLYKEYIYYFSSIEDAYLCTKNGTESKNKEELFLYVDLGEIGDWWGDPFDNLEKEAVEI